MRELALVIPEDVTLTNLNGSAFENAEGSASHEPIGAPNLTISGCAASHKSVAGFVAALEDIDGVTRVGLARTEEVEQSRRPMRSDVGDSTLCGTANTFDLSVAFDNAAVSAAAAEAAVGRDRRRHQPSPCPRTRLRRPRTRLRSRPRRPRRPPMSSRGW